MEDGMKLALIRHVMGVALALAFAGSAAAQPADPLPAPTDPVAQVNLGLEREAAGKFEEAVHWYRLAAEQGNASAQNNMAYMLVTGSGIAQDFAAAFEWLKKSAAQGDPAGQNNLGLMYSSGQGVDRDFAEAVRWYGLAAEQGMALAQLNLATLIRTAGASSRTRCRHICGTASRLNRAWPPPPRDANLSRA